LRAKFPNAKRQLWPGELINALLLLETRPNAPTISAAAVQQGPNGAYVYVIQPDGKVRLQPVTVAQIAQGQALIDSGLKGGENVVTDGQYRLQPGSLVKELHGKATQEADLQSAVEQAIP
jgi:multidrug efflux system membrane fusion protein